MPASSLSSLFPAEPFWIGGERVSLRPVVLGELRQVDRLMAAWGRLVARGGEGIEEEAVLDLQELLACAAGRPLAWVQGLDEDAFSQLFTGCLALNQDLFQDAGKKEGETLNWAQVVQRLLAYGHRMEDIRGYTLAQAEAFLNETARLERERLANDIVASAHAMVDGKHVEKTIRELRRG